MKRKIICMALAVLTMSLAAVGCGKDEITQSYGEVSPESSVINADVKKCIVGAWGREDEVVYEFLADGTFIYPSGNARRTGTYNISADKTLSMKIELGNYSYQYVSLEELETIKQQNTTTAVYWCVDNDKFILYHNGLEQIYNRMVE